MSVGKKAFKSTARKGNLNVHSNKADSEDQDLAAQNMQPVLYNVCYSEILKTIAIMNSKLFAPYFQEENVLQVYLAL